MLPRILLADFSTIPLAPPPRYTHLLRQRLKAQEIIKRRWNPTLLKRGSQCFSRGLLSIGTVLQKHEYPVVYRHSPLRWRDIDEEVERFDIIGASCTTASVNRALEFLRFAKQAKADLLTVLGGPHASAKAIELLAEYPEIVDLVVTGEGETAMVEIADAVRESGTVAGFRSGAYGGLDRRLIDGTERARSKNAPIVNPGYELLPYSLLNYGVNVNTSRGCPFACRYCSETEVIGPYRRTPIPQVLDELRDVASRVPHGTMVHFCDSVFNFDRSHLASLVVGIRRARLGLAFSCDLRPDCVDVESIALMRDAGFVKYCVGIETSQESVLRQNGRMQSVVDVLVALRTIRECDRRAFVVAYFLAGLPGSTSQGMLDDARFMRQLLLSGLTNAIGNKVLVPYPGTAVHQNPSELGVKIRHSDWRLYSRFGPPVYDLAMITGQEIFRLFLQQEAVVLQTYCGLQELDCDALADVHPSDYVYEYSLNDVYQDSAFSCS